MSESIAQTVWGGSLATQPRWRDPFEGSAPRPSGHAARRWEAFAAPGRKHDLLPGLLVPDRVSICDFLVPDVEQRLLLWERCLGRVLPRSASLDLKFCAESFELAGGNSRSVAVTAAYLSAESGEPVTMTDLIRGVQREYQKLGRLTLAAEFGPIWGCSRDREWPAVACRAYS